jgi:ketosteroid isomerase-like protein
MEHPNEAIVREMYRAFSRGDFATARGLVADDITWHYESDVVGGTARGTKEVLAQFARLLAASAGTLRGHIGEVVAADDRVTLRGRFTAERDGHRLDDAWEAVLAVRDGKVTEVRLHSEDQDAADRFWRAATAAG